MRRVGIGYRDELTGWLASGPAEVQCLEITAEHFFDRPESELAALARRYPLFVHGLGLSLGTPGPLDRDQLARFARVARAAEARWVSEHVAFTRTAEIDLGHLNAVPLTPDSLAVLVEHAIELREACGRPLLLENVTSYFLPGGGLREPEFLNRLCERAGCGLLLDVTNLYVNARNHGFCPRVWLSELDRSRVRQLHVVGYSRDEGRWHDWHAAAIQSDLWELIELVLATIPVEAVILERDHRFPAATELEAELTRLGRNDGNA